MEVTLNLATIAQILAIITAFGAIWATQHQRRLIAVKEGERNAEIKALKEKITSQEAEIRRLDEKGHCTEVDLGKMNEKIDTIMEMMREVKDRIDLIAPPTVRDQGK